MNSGYKLIEFPLEWKVSPEAENRKEMDEGEEYMSFELKSSKL